MASLQKTYFALLGKERAVPNARDVKNLQDHLTVLLIGPPGAGKTTQYHTLGGRGFIYIFDPNALASLAGLDVDYEIFSSDLLDINVHPLASKTRDGKQEIKPDKVVKTPEPLAYTQWEEHYERGVKDGLFKDYDWIGFDSFTTFSDAVMDRVMWLNGRFGKQPEQDDWSTQRQTILSVARSITANNKLWVATAHEELVQDKVSGRTTYQPVLTGKLKIRIPLLFSCIYRCGSDEDGFYFNTVSDKMHPYIRSSIKGLERDIDVSIPVKNKEFVNPQEHGLGKILRDAGYLSAPHKSDTPKKGK
ncbi:MAG: hypothetical protein C5B59_17390 [Bacteroidetes bacterium]|nr:MAG: hypothetical protein C5B59_17390 [Bacteroidota bacterium]